MKYGILFLLIVIAIGDVAIRGGPWCWLLLYPAFSFGVVAAGYFGVGPSVFGKLSKGVS